MTTPDGYPALAMYIDGEWTAGAGSRRDPVINPATGDVLAEVPLAETADLERAAAAAERGFRQWRDLPIERRSQILHGASALMRQRAKDIGRIMTREQGKPLPEATGEVIRAATLLDWDCEEGRRAYGRIIPAGPDQQLSVLKEPIGPVAAFIPWNFPAGGPMRKIAAAISAGCSIVIKASEETPGTVSALVQCLADAGLPPGVVNLVFGVPSEVSEYLIPHPAIRFVAFTGSIPVGKHLAGLAAQVMKPAIMELGGHAPVIVCDDADPDTSAAECVKAKFINAGQVCTSPSRFLVHESLYDKFVAAFVQATEAVRVGDGLDDGIQMGPMASDRRRAAVHELITDARDRGATVLTGGHALDGPGFFYAPTVLTDVPPDSRLLHEEPFGPVAPILPFSDLESALAEANSLPYGLAAYGFTRSADYADRLTRGFEAGILSINHCGGSVPVAPSGGFKESGYGREGGSEGLEGYLITKRVSHRLRG